MTKINKEETWEERRLRENTEFKEHSLPEFHKFMKQHDVKYFTVEFNGGGDSGDFEDVCFVKSDEIPDYKTIQKEAGIPDGTNMYDMANIDNKKMHNKYEALREYYNDPMRLGRKYIWYKPTHSDEHRSTNLADYICDFIGEYMNYQQIDWYNNEGGSGLVKYEDKVLSIEVETYWRDSEITTFEEVDNG